MRHLLSCGDKVFPNVSMNSIYEETECLNVSRDKVFPCLLRGDKVSPHFPYQQEVRTHVQ